MECFIHRKTHIKLHVLTTQSFGPRSLCPLCSETEVTRVAGRILQRILSEFTCICADSSLTAHFDLRWTVANVARVAACVLQIGCINIASTTGNNVGTSSSVKEILA